MSVSKFPTLAGALALLACVLLPALPVAAAHAAPASGDALRLHQVIAAEQRRAPAAAPRLERRALQLRPSVRLPTLSPDGRQLAWLREQPRERSLWLQSTGGGAARELLRRSSAQQLYWSGDSRWLLLESSDQLSAMAVDGQTGSGLVTTLGGKGQRRLLAVDASRPAAVIVLEQTTQAAGATPDWSLRRIDLQGGSELLIRSAQQITDFALDRHGQLAFVQRLDGDDLVILQLDSSGAARERTRCVRLQRCALLGIGDNGADLLLRGDLGRSRSALLQLDRQGRLRLLHEDPQRESDLDQVVLDPRTAQPLIASYRSTAAASYGLTAEARGHLQAIASLLPGTSLDYQIGVGPDARWLLCDSASTTPIPQCHLYNPQTATLQAALDDAGLQLRDGKPAQPIAATALADKLPIRWSAADGMPLHGFLSLPPGRDPKTLPLLALVHGGPWNQARAQFSPLVQLLANRGYAVFEPNFRGSTGLGRDHLLAPDGDFGNGRVQQDIVDGVRFLLAEGIGDPQRVGIAGASFGGYSALLGATFQPELFKAAVAIVPSTDLAWDMTWVARSSEALALSGKLPFERWLRILSLDLADAQAMQRLHAQSPLANVERLQRPVLLLAGAEDRRVAIRGVAEYAARLKLLGKPFSLFVDPQAGHSNDIPVAREAALYLVESFLHQQLGGDPATPPDAALQDYLRRIRQVGGEQF